MAEAGSGFLIISEDAPRTAVDGPSEAFTRVLNPTPAHPLKVLKDGQRANVLRYAQLKADGHKKSEIASRMGISVESLDNQVRRAVKEGWLVIEDPHERFQTEIVPEVVENIKFFIKKKDLKMTIEAAKGAGIFKSHAALKVEGEAPQTILALKIEMPPSMAANPPKITGIVGKPRKLIEGEIIEDEEEESA